MKQAIRIIGTFFIGLSPIVVAQQSTDSTVPAPPVQERAQTSQPYNGPLVVVQREACCVQTARPAQQQQSPEIYEERRKKEQEKAIVDEQAAIERARQTDLQTVAKTKTFYVQSQTIFVNRGQLVGEVRNRDGFKDLQLVEVDNPRSAEVILTVDHIHFTFDYSYKAVDKKTSVVLAAGKVTALHGYFAAMELAHAFVNDMKKMREQEKKESKEKPVSSESKSELEKSKPTEISPITR